MPEANNIESNDQEMQEKLIKQIKSYKSSITTYSMKVICMIDKLLENIEKPETLNETEPAEGSGAESDLNEYDQLIADLEEIGERVIRQLKADRDYELSIRARSGGI
jgi:hypothetical protein